MAEQPPSNFDPDEFFADMFRGQTDLVASLLGDLAPLGGKLAGELTGGLVDKTTHGAEATVQWADVAKRMQALWIDFQTQQAGEAVRQPAPLFDPVKWLGAAQSVLAQLPLSEPEIQKRLWEDGLDLATSVLGQYGIGPRSKAMAAEGEVSGGGQSALPRSDARFADPRWRASPFFALVHQAYLMLSEQLVAMADNAQGLEADRKQQLVFATRVLADALSPANFPLTNPVALERAAETRGDSLVRGMENLLGDIRRGQLTHSRRDMFRVGENIADTPGKVVHETPLFQLIQYSPTTEKVLRTPVVIFPPWINRFYILDLNARKSFVRWAVDQGMTVFMTSWRSADESMADVVWDDYIAAQIEAIDVVCGRMKVASVHAVGYCVAGTTLAATLAVLARKRSKAGGGADKVKSATFFTAQVDFAEAGDLKNFIDDHQIDAVSRLATNGYLDGRYMAAAFNLLRGNDLIWNYVGKNYLEGEDYPAFDMLHWNGDVTNLPAKWHRQYLRDLYRDNRLVIPDSLHACGVPIDLRRIEVPCYIQAGREDHIAPPQSVWKLTRHLQGPLTFVLAGSGHIAGVVNPPAANKYQYWINDDAVDTLSAFMDGATEYPGSWWPHWRDWIGVIDSEKVPARGRRKPGGRGDIVIEDAPGRYVKSR